MKISACCKKIPLLFFLFFLPALHNSVQAAPFGASGEVRRFINKNDDYKRLMGLTAGIGKITTDEHEQGTSLYLNAYLFWFNFSVEYQDFGQRSATNTYTGLGLGRYLQLQYGYGNEGYLMRARSEFEVIGRFTVFIARERYRDKPLFDNTSIGIGYNF